MNKKQLIVAAIATVMSVSSANATNITGVTGVPGADLAGNIYNIDPSQVNGDVGYRYYDNFNLTSGDVANLIFQAKNGDQRALNTFINLVGGSDKININGILNTIDGNGAFKNGHAVFISPNGMVVGASGVLNIGTLSVLTPEQNKFNALKKDYDSAKFDVINNISAMRNGADANYGGNALVDIQGKIVTRGVGNNGSGVGVDIRGSQVNISGQIYNGYNGNEVLHTTNHVSSLFNKLVNTNEVDGRYIANDAGRIVIKSGNGTGGINITNTGKIVNYGNKETAITNHGVNGLQVAGTVDTNGKLNIYNNNAASALTVNGNLTNKNADLSLSSTGGINVQKDAVINTDRNLEIVNTGGALAFAGNAVSKGKTDIVNRGSNGMNISGTIGDINNTSTVRIVNENGKLTFTGNANAKESVSVRNQANKELAISGTGMDVGGTIKAGEGVLVHNKVGDANLSGNITVTKGNIAVMNEGNGSLTTTSTSSLNGNGNVAVKNSGANGMTLNGTIVNTNAVIGEKKGETAINNLAGNMAVNGNITNAGNMGIINKGEGTATLAAQIDNTGDLKVANVNGESLTVNGKVANKDGNLTISNYNGDFAVNGEVTNSDGVLFLYSRNNSEGLTTGANSLVKNNNGDLAIKHNGTGTDATGKGLNLNGKIEKTGTGELAINNYNGDTAVNGIINTDSETAIRNRKGSEDLAVNATITSTNNKELRIQNEVGTGDMTVGGTINHNGRLNILNNEGTLTLNGTVNNTGNDRTYAISKNNTDGIEVTKDFNATTTDGMIYILNKDGALGLNYAGNATSTNGQVELYNKAGDMTVTGAMNGQPAVILNTGDDLTVTDQANLQGDVKIVQKGSGASNVSKNYEDKFRK